MQTNNILRRFKRFTALSAALLLLVMMFTWMVPPRHAAADQISARSLTLQAGTDPGSKPGGSVNHLFQFTLPNPNTVDSGNLGSIAFEYCTTAADVGAQTCQAPTGLDTSTVSGMDDSGSAVTGWSLAATQPNNHTVVIDRTVAIAGTALTMKIQLQGVTNPTTANYTFFVRITSYSGADQGGSVVDTGTVAAATANPIDLTGVMPESLVFCTGATVDTTNNVPDCSKATAGSVSFNQLFSSTTTAYANSQMAASTNAGFGYSITVNGATLKSGVTNQINAMGTADYSKPGISQFGMNLVKNTNFCGASCDVGADVTQTGGTLYNGEVLTGYSTGGDNTTTAGEGAQFKYVDGDPIADSTNTASDAQIYTSSYIVNVPGSQPAGTYKTTLTYICTAKY